MALLFPSIDVIKRKKPQPTEGEWTLLRFLVDNYNDEYEVYFQPFLNTQAFSKETLTETKRLCALSNPFNRNQYRKVLL